MEKILIVLGISFFICLSGCQDADVENTTAEIVVNKSCLLVVDGMTCEKGCKSIIESKLKQAKGVFGVEVDFEQKMAVVNYDENKISSSELIAIVESIGDALYKAQLVEERVVNDVSPTTKTSAQKEQGASVKEYSFEIPDITEWLDLF